MQRTAIASAEEIGPATSDGVRLQRAAVRPGSGNALIQRKVAAAELQPGTTSVVVDRITVASGRDSYFVPEGTTGLVTEVPRFGGVVAIHVTESSDVELVGVNVIVKLDAVTLKSTSSTPPPPPSAPPGPPAPPPAPEAPGQGPPPAPEAPGQGPPAPGAPGPAVIGPTAPGRAAAVAPAVGAVGGLFALLSPGDVDVGKQFLKRLRDERPDVINDASVVGSASALSNCALDTIGAIVGKSASETAVDVQTRLGGRADDETNRKFQDQTMWATQLLPASIAPLEAAGIIQTVSAPALEIVGEAQLYGMIRYLQQALPGSPVPAPELPDDASPETNGGAPQSFTIYRHGQPGSDGDAEAELLTAMGKYPSGTRFAVFVYSSDTSQHVRQHWVYAEKIGDSVGFSDFQANVQKGQRVKVVDPAAEVLGKFPTSPDRQDKGKGFESGCFVAIVPSFEGAPPVTVPDTEMTESGVDAVLGLAKLRLDTLREVYGVDGPASGSVDPSTFTSAPSPDRVKIPSPAMVKKQVDSFFTDVGVPATSRLGANPENWIIEVLGEPKIDFAEGFAQLQFMSQADRVEAVDEDGGATGEKIRATGDGKFAHADSLTGGLSFLGGTSALAGDGNILVNPGLFHFPDLIHEVFHTYANSSADKPFDEGCTEVFASMVASKIEATSQNADYAYVYNPDYTPYVARIHRLIDLVGLHEVVRAYLGPAAPDVVLAAAFIRLGADSAITEDAAAGYASAVTSKAAFPAGFDTAMDELEKHRAPSTAPDASNADLEREKLAFAAAMQTARSDLLATGSLPGDVAQSGAMSRPDIDKVADATAHATNVKANEAELERYYPILKKARGAPYVALLSHVAAVEKNLAALTGQSEESVHERFARPTTVTVEFSDATGVVGPGDSVHIWGDIDEFGGGAGTAVPLRRSSNGFVSMPIELIHRRGSAVELHVIAGATGREVVSATVSVPDAATATVRATVDSIVIS